MRGLHRPSPADAGPEIPARGAEAPRRRPPAQVGKPCGTRPLGVEKRAVDFASARFCRRTPAPVLSRNVSAVKQEFQQEHPCPSTARTGGACPGYRKDHIKAARLWRALTRFPTSNGRPSLKHVADPGADRRRAGRAAEDAICSARLITHIGGTATPAGRVCSTKAREQGS
jgi:hypothetical protein